jgi:hypothetical protein
MSAVHNPNTRVFMIVSSCSSANGGCHWLPDSTGIGPGCDHHIGAAPADASEVYSVLAPAMPIADEMNAAR